MCLEAFAALTGGKKDFTWSNLFYGSSSLDGPVLRTSYSPSGDFGMEIYNGIGLWKNATWNGKGTGIIFANASSNPFSKTLKIRVDTNPDHGKKYGPARYWPKDDEIVIYKDFMSRYTQAQREGIIAHELGHAMGLEHGCKDTLMQGANSLPGQPTSNPFVPTGFDVFILQRVR